MKQSRQQGPVRSGERGVGTRNHVVQFISIITCAVWIVSLAVIIDPEPAGFHTGLDARTTVFAESDSGIENYDKAWSDVETVAVLPSDGSPGTDPAADPPPSSRFLRRKGIAPGPTGGNARFATTVLHP